MILDITIRFIIINKFGIFQKVGQNDRKLSKNEKSKSRVEADFSRESYRAPTEL